MSRTLTKQLVIRCDEALAARLAADAADNGRTVAQSVRFHLNASLARLVPGEPEPTDAKETP